MPGLSYWFVAGLRGEDLAGLRNGREQNPPFPLRREPEWQLHGVPSIQWQIWTIRHLRLQFTVLRGSLRVQRHHNRWSNSRAEHLRLDYAEIDGGLRGRDQRLVHLPGE